MAVDEAADTVSCNTLDCGGEVFRRHMQSLGIVAHLTLGAADAGGEQVGQLTDDVGGAVAVEIGGITLCMRLEDVIHHRQAETSHQFVIEQQMTVAHAVAETVEVGKQDSSLLVGEFDDRILVERDASTNTVIVRWQQARKEFVVGGEPLYLHLWNGDKALCATRIWHYHQIVFPQMIALFVKHETPLPICTQQVHTSVTQSRVIHPKEVRSVLKINFHGAKLQIISFLFHPSR